MKNSALLVGRKPELSRKCSPQITIFCSTLFKGCFLSRLHLNYKQLWTQRENESNQIATIWSQKICQKRFPSFQKQDKIKKERHAILNQMSDWNLKWKIILNWATKISPNCTTAYVINWGKRTPAGKQNAELDDKNNSVLVYKRSRLWCHLELLM